MVSFPDKNIIKPQVGAMSPVSSSLFLPIRKFIIWEGICSCDQKTKVFVTNRTMDSKVYKQKCLEKRILPFCTAPIGPVKFGPDLASCHYIREVVQWYQYNEVDFIKKEINPPNCVSSAQSTNIGQLSSRS